eukprot:evm.model.scf_2407.2 EVM.evm.TU.scf_2407.2   scf_2407:6282-7336(+)
MDPPSPPGDLREGRVAQIHGLSRRADLNGRLCLVHPRHGDRWPVEVIHTSERVLVRSANLELRDRLVEAHASAELGDQDDCVAYVKALMCAMLPAGSDASFSPMGDPWPEGGLVGMLAAIDAAEAGAQCLVAVDMSAFGHAFALHAVRTRLGVRARLLHSWVKDEVEIGSGPRQAQGFTAAEWLRSGGCAWMGGEGRPSLESFCLGVGRLRAKVARICEADLAACAREATGSGDAAMHRAWARGLLEGIEGEGLTMQPFGVEAVEAYRRDLEARGLARAHAVLYYGLSAGRPRQILDFPLEDFENVGRLFGALFRVEVGPHQWVKLVEYRGHEDAGFTFTVMPLDEPPVEN